MILEIADAYCIDRSEVHLVGHSLGGWFAQKLACARGDIVRSVTAVGSAGWSGTCTGPAASLIYQNPDDALSPYSA
jgi:polyhydroxybutyrate depolymerase